MAKNKVKIVAGIPMINRKGSHTWALKIEVWPARDTTKDWMWMVGHRTYADGKAPSMAKAVRAALHSIKEGGGFIELERT